MFERFVSALAIAERTRDDEAVVWAHLAEVKAGVATLNDPIPALEMVRSIEVVARLLFSHYQWRDITSSDYRAELPWRVATAGLELLVELHGRFSDHPYAPVLITEARALAARNADVFTHGGATPLLEAGRRMKTELH